MNIRETIEANSEKVRLVGYFFIMIFVAAPLFSSLGEGWRNSNIIKPLILSLGPLINVSLEQFSAFVFGIYNGLLILLILDPKKRIQGLLLSFGTGSALLALLTRGLFIPNIDFTANILLVIGGFVIGGIIGGGRGLFKIRTNSALEFRRSAQLFYIFMTTVIVLGLLEFHITFPEIIQVGEDTVTFVFVENPEIAFEQDGLITNGSLALVLIVTLRSFFQYDSSENFFILGPVGSGKSLFLVGKYLAALDNTIDRDNDTPMTPSGDLMELVSDVDAASEEAGWELGATSTGDVKNLEFTYVKGRVFPKNIRIGSLDYAGEYLDQLSDALMSSPDEIDDSVLRNLSQRVDEASTLVFILDVERYNRNESLEIESYFDILDAVDDTKILLVATKCDVLAEDFEDEMGLDPVVYFDEFKEYVNETLTQNDQTVKTLVQDTAGSEIHPVYYQTTMRNEERVPMRDAHGNVQTMGFDELLKIMG